MGVEPFLLSSTLLVRKTFDDHACRDLTIVARHADRLDVLIQNHGAVGRGDQHQRPHPFRMIQGQPLQDHPAHRHTDPNSFVDLQLVCQHDQVVGKSIDRETGRRLFRIAIPAQIHRDAAKLRRIGADVFGKDVAGRHHPVHEDDRITRARFQHAQTQTVHVDQMTREGLIGRNDVGQLRRMRAAIGPHRRSRPRTADDPDQA